MKDQKRIVIPSEDEVAQYAGDHGASGEEQGGQRVAPESGQIDEKSGEVPPPAEEEWKDKFLRARAELSNYQRRAEKDRAEALRYANAGLAKSLLPVLDNLERLVQSSADPAATVQTLGEGARLTLEGFLKALREHHVEPIDAEGQPFDPLVHEALLEQPSPDHDQRVVLQQIARGYKLHDRVLRPSRVIVSKPAATPARDVAEEKKSQ
jgi:molecular chaperone GrpE